MDLQTFWDNFEIIAEAPGGIAKLRALILDLAVRGKLVPQDTKDEPNSCTIRTVHFEKLLGKKVAFSKVRNISEDEYLYKIPENWIWKRLGALGLTQTGTTPSKTNPDS